MNEVERAVALACEVTLCEVARELINVGAERALVNAVLTARQLGLPEGKKGRLVQIAELIENPELLTILMGGE